MAVVRWVLTDPVTLQVYELPINPSAGGSPSYAKNNVYSVPLAPDGQVIVFEGRDQPQKIEFSGVLFTEDEFNAFVEWYTKRYQVAVTDDLGREFSILIDSFTPTRERAVSKPWKHSYQVAATIVDWPA